MLSTLANATAAEDRLAKFKTWCDEKKPWTKNKITETYEKQSGFFVVDEPPLDLANPAFKPRTVEELMSTGCVVVKKDDSALVLYKGSWMSNLNQESMKLQGTSGTLLEVMDNETPYQIEKLKLIYDATEDESVRQDVLYIARQMLTFVNASSLPASSRSNPHGRLINNTAWIKDNLSLDFMRTLWAARMAQKGDMYEAKIEEIVKAAGVPRENLTFFEMNELDGFFGTGKSLDYGYSLGRFDLIKDLQMEPGHEKCEFGNNWMGKILAEVVLHKTWTPTPKLNSELMDLVDWIIDVVKVEEIKSDFPLRAKIIEFAPSPVKRSRTLSFEVPDSA